MDRLLSAPEPLIHSVLVALCDDDRIQARALKYLAELQNYATQIGGRSDSADASGEANPLKRKVSASEPAQLCIQCEHAFSVGDNSPTACLYHSGELEIMQEHEVWAGGGGDVGGPHETSKNQEDHPEAFIWTCCDKEGIRPGCTKGYHLAVRKSPFKRFEMYSPPEADAGIDRLFQGRILKANEFVNESLEPATTSGYASTRDWNSNDDSASERTERNSERNEGRLDPVEDEGLEVM